MKRKIILNESNFHKLYNLLLKEEITSSIDDRKAEMKKDGIGNMRLPMDSNIASVTWANKQTQSKSAPSDGNIKQLLSDTKQYIEMFKDGDESCIENLKKSAYSLLKFWSESAIAVSNKLTFNEKKNPNILGLLEPSAKQGLFGDFFGIVCKFYYFPEMLELLYTNEYFESLREPFDICVSSALKVVRAAVTGGLKMSSFNNHNLKLLFPLEWSEFALKRKGLKDGSIQPSFVLPEIEITSNETNKKIFNDDDFSW